MSSGSTPVVTQTIAAAQDACTVPCDGTESVVFAVTAGLTGTLTTEGSIDGVTFFSIPSWGTTGGAASGSFANPAAQLIIVMGGPALKTVRARCSAYTSGSCVVTGQSDDTGIPSYQGVNVLTSGNIVLTTGAVASASQTTPFLRHRVVSAATDNPTNVKGSAGNVHFLLVSNDGVAKAFLKLYDKATAPSNADTPVETILLPLGTIQVPIQDALLRHPFAAGIGYRITGLLADGDATAVVAGAIALNMLYI